MHVYRLVRCVLLIELGIELGKDFMAVHVRVDVKYDEKSKDEEELFRVLMPHACSLGPTAVNLMGQSNCACVCGMLLCNFGNGYAIRAQTKGQFY